MCSMPGWPVGLMPVRTTSMALSVLAALRAALVAERAQPAAEADVLELHAQIVGVGRVDLRHAVARPRFGGQALGLERGDRRRGIEVTEAEADVIDVRHRVRSALVDPEKGVADGEIDAALLCALDGQAEHALVERHGTVEVGDDQARVIQRCGPERGSGLSRTNG